MEIGASAAAVLGRRELAVDGDGFFLRGELFFDQDAVPAAGAVDEDYDGASHDDDRHGAVEITLEGAGGIGGQGEEVVDDI